MKLTLRLISNFMRAVPLMLIICLGIISALVGLHRLDAWCERQLTDTDGQPES